MVKYLATLLQSTEMLCRISITAVFICAARITVKKWATVMALSHVLKFVLTFRHCKCSSSDAGNLARRITPFFTLWHSKRNQCHSDICASLLRIPFKCSFDCCSITSITSCQHFLLRVWTAASQQPFVATNLVRQVFNPENYEACPVGHTWGSAF